MKGPARSGAADCAALLRQGLELIDALGADEYAGEPVVECGTDGEAQQAWASPGAHTRHLLDFLDCLFSGIDARKIDYTERKRRADVERCQAVGLREVQRCLERIEILEQTDERLALRVRTDAGQPWTDSTLARELQFVATHVLHHYALIRLTLAHRGIEAPPEFGVSLATLAHRERGND